MVRPDPNLPPQSAAWGRSVNAALNSFTEDLRRAQGSSLVNNQQVTSTMNALTEQVASLEELARFQQEIGGELPTFTGVFAGATPTITMTSKSGRFEVTYAATVGVSAQGTLYFTTTGGHNMDYASAMISNATVPLVSGTLMGQSNMGNLVVFGTPGVPTTFRLGLEMYSGNVLGSRLAIRPIL